MDGDERQGAQPPGQSWCGGGGHRAWHGLAKAKTSQETPQALRQQDVQIQMLLQAQRCNTDPMQEHFLPLLACTPDAR